MTTRIAFLGPRGSFAEAALRALPISDEAELIAAASVQAALDAARDGSVDFALVPIENSVEGAVSITLDELANGEPLAIVDEAVLAVTFSLVVRPGTTLSDITRIATHPHAAAQVRGWISDNLPDAVMLPALSTAAAAQGLLDPACGYDAAVSQRIVTELYDVESLADGIEDTPDAITRFVLVQRPGSIPERTGADKTTLSLFILSDQPGALLAILNEFAAHGVNLTRIESRPTRKQLGDYYFSVDIEGHVNDARVSEALMGLHRVCLDVRFMGSYPRHDGRAPVLREGVADSDFAEAHQWLRRLKGEI